MVIEHYRLGAAPVYERFAERGRMLTEGTEFIDSWVVDEPEPRTCYQLMRAADEAALLEWFSQWSDIVDFEYYPVVDTATAQSRNGT